MKKTDKLPKVIITILILATFIGSICLLHQVRYNMKERAAIAQLQSQLSALCTQYAIECESVELEFTMENDSINEYRYYTAKIQLEDNHNLASNQVYDFLKEVESLQSDAGNADISMIDTAYLTQTDGRYGIFADCGLLYRDHELVYTCDADLKKEPAETYTDEYGVTYGVDSMEYQQRYGNKLDEKQPIIDNNQYEVATNITIK